MRIAQYALDGSGKVHINEGAEIIDVIWVSGGRPGFGSIYLVVLEYDVSFMDLRYFNPELIDSENTKGKYIGKAYDGERWWFVFEEKH